MGTDLGIAFRLQRLELVATILGVSLLAGAVFLAGSLIPDVLSQLEKCLEADPMGMSCHAESTAAFVLGGTVFIGTPAGVILLLGSSVLMGGPLVAGELERRTAALAWSLNPSRRRWLLRRVLPVLGVLMLGAIAMAAAGEHGLRATLPDGQLGFGQYDAVAPIVVARVLFLFGVALLVGTITGRLLPAVVITALLAVALAAGLTAGRDVLMRAEAEPMPVDSIPPGSPTFDHGFRDESSGQILTWEQAYERDPDAFDAGVWPLPGLTEMAWTVRPERLPDFVLREVVLVAGLTAVAGAATLFALERRRL